MAQNIIYNPEKEIKVLDYAYWLLLFGLFWRFSFVSAFSHFSD